MTIKINIKCVVLLVFTLILTANGFATQNTAPQKLNWLMAHEPSNVFDQAFSKFKSEVESATSGRLAVNKVTLEEMGINGHPKSVIEAVKSGKVQMAQALTTFLGNQYPPIQLFDLPFLFQDYDQAEKFISSEDGHSVLAGLDKVGLKGLAFTYSGGFRVIPSEKQISSVESFKGLNIRISDSKVTKSLYKNLSARGIVREPKKALSEALNGELDGIEITLIRYKHLLEGKKPMPILNNTKHSLFATVLLANPNFIKGLSKEDQKIVFSAAHMAAKIEREVVIKQELEVIAWLREKGVTIVELDDKNKKIFANQTKPIFREFEKKIGKSVIDRIKKERILLVQSKVQ